MKSISGIICYIKNLDKTVKFYETLGFTFKTRQPAYARAYLNWFWIEFLAADKEDKPEFQKEAKLEPRGAGLYLHISVEGIDDFYKSLLAKGLKPSSQPRDWPWGHREFVIRDPDGYKLVFFQKL